MSVFYVCGVFIGFLPIIVLFIFDLQFRDAFWQSLMHVFEWQLPLPIPFFWKVSYGGQVNLHFFHALAVGFVCVLVPITYFLGVLFLYKEARSNSPKRSIIFLLGASSLAGIPYLFQAFDRADFGHIAQSTLPVFIAYAAIISFRFSDKRLQTLSFGACSIVIVILLSAWLPRQPAFQMIRLETLYAGSTVKYPIGGQDFVLRRYQASLLEEVKNMAKLCKIGDRQFLALPHFPGVYAYLGLKAPFWEMYYLYQRADEFQLQHIDAISEVRLVLISPNATVDGLEKHKLKNTYGKLLTYIEENFDVIHSPALPYGTYMYINPIAGC